MYSPVRFHIPAPVPALSLWAQPADVAAPSGAVVACVLQFGDVWETRDDGASLVRISPERLEREDIRLLLGEGRHRALDISLVWDETEQQLVQVIDLAPLRAAAFESRLRGFPRYQPTAVAA